MFRFSIRDVLWLMVVVAMLWAADLPLIGLAINRCLNLGHYWKTEAEIWHAVETIQHEATSVRR